MLKMVVDDELLTKMAAEELLEEARRGAIRAKTMGPEGWKKCPLPKTNKLFLRNTLQSTLYKGSHSVDKRSKHIKH